MKNAPTASLLALILTGALAAGCGSKSHAGGHAGENATPAPAPPTPDTTPIEALRTPAGMLLKTEGPTPTPAPAK